MKEPRSLFIQHASVIIADWYDGKISDETAICLFVKLILSQQ